MRITVGRRFTAKLAAPAALAMLLTCALRCEPRMALQPNQLPTSGVRSRNYKRRSTSSRARLQRSRNSRNSCPPPADQKPQTIGETVGSLGKSVDDIRTNLATNLGIQVHGLADVTYDYNLNHPNTSNGSKGGPNPTAPGGCLNQLHEFDADCNTYSLAQFNLHIARVSDGGVGFVTDLNFGELANVMAASTRYSNINPGAVSNNMFDLTQAYLTYTVPVGQGINLQAGRMVTLLGAEIIPTYNNQNFNESRGLLFTLGEPLTQTGIRGTYAFNSNVSQHDARRQQRLGRRRG